MAESRSEGSGEAMGLRFVAVSVLVFAICCQASIKAQSPFLTLLVDTSPGSGRSIVGPVFALNDPITIFESEIQTFEGYNQADRWFDSKRPL